MTKYSKNAFEYYCVEVERTSVNIEQALYDEYGLILVNDANTYGGNTMETATDLFERGQAAGTFGQETEDQKHLLRFAKKVQQDFGENVVLSALDLRNYKNADATKQQLRNALAKQAIRGQLNLTEKTETCFADSLSLECALVRHTINDIIA